MIHFIIVEKDLQCFDMVREEGVLLIGFSITMVPEDTTFFDRMTAFHLQNGIQKNRAVLTLILLLTKLPVIMVLITL